MARLISKFSKLLAYVALALPLAAQATDPRPVHYDVDAGKMFYQRANDTDVEIPYTGPQGPAGATGATGATGAAGADGVDGVGVPAGGVAGQVLSKITSADYDTQWVNQTGGSSGGVSDGFVDVRTYGNASTCSGSWTVSDTAAVQAAVNAAIAASPDKQVFSPGWCYLPTPVMISHPVNATENPLRFVGGGYQTTNAIAMFDSTNPYYAVGGGAAIHPPEEEIEFDGTSFRTNNSALNAYVMSGKFLRVRFFDNVHYRAIKLANSTTYAQSWHVGGQAYGWTGTFGNFGGSYDLDVTHWRGEAGGAGFTSNGPNAGTVGLKVTNSLLEGSTGPLLSAAYVLGAEISGNYTESNANPDIKLNLDARDNRGIHIAGNYLQPNATNAANSAFYSVVLSATTKKVASSGNYGTRLYDNPAGAELDSRQDYASAAITKNAISGGGSTDCTYTPTWNGGGTLTISKSVCRVANGLVHLEGDITFPTASGSAFAVLGGLPFPLTNGEVFGTIGLCTATACYSNGIYGSPSIGGFWVMKDNMGNPNTITTLSGKHLNFNIQYAN